MITWGQLIGYSDSKVVRGFDFFVLLSVAVGNLNEAMKPFDVAVYLPWIYHFWFVGGVSNIAGVGACRTLLPPEIRLHRSVEKFIDAKRVVATKSDEDDLDQAKHESAAISVALFSTFGVELTEEQKSSVAERLLEHLNGEALPAQGRHSIVLQKQWMSIDEAWSWQKGLVVALFLAGSTLYLLFIILLIVKGWNAIRTG